LKEIVKHGIKHVLFYHCPDTYKNLELITLYTTRCQDCLYMV